MSYQFIHIEDYGRNVSKKKKNDGKNDKYKKESKGRSVREIIAEAKRENGNCPHVENPEDPKLLYGVDLDQVEKLAYEYHENTKIQDKNGKEKKLRSDANILLAGVISLSRDNIEIWEEYKNDSIQYLKNKYGKNLISVIEHTDEANPHIHFYCIQNTGRKFDLIHDGKKALFENKDKIKHEQNIAYIEAMRNLQEDFWKVVSKNFGLTKDGPKRARLSRSDYFKQSREVKLLDQVKVNAVNQGKKQGYNKAINDFHDRSWFNKVSFVKTYKIKELETETAALRKRNKAAITRKNVYKEKLGSTVEEYENKLTEQYELNKKNSKNLYLTLKKTEKLEEENKQLKIIENDHNNLLLNVNLEISKQVMPFKLKANKLEKENDKLTNENSEINTFMNKVKKYYGDRFDEWKSKINKIGGYKIK